MIDTMVKPNPLSKTNQLFRELLSVSGFDPFVAHATSPRKQMYATHMGQHVSPMFGTERSYQTGMERAYAKYSFNIKAPTTMEVIAVISRYPKRVDSDYIEKNPQTVVIYEELATKTIGALDIRTFKANHPYFGFDYVPRPGSNQLRVKEVIEKDTVFFDSPSVTPLGAYKYGVELNILPATLPSGSEDGVMISKSAAKRFTYTTFEHRVAECGPDLVPLNMYGNDDSYQIGPEIGQRVRDDGILMAFRDTNDNLAPFLQSKHALQEYFPRFDKAIYVPAGGIVEDIIIHHDPLSKQARVPLGMTKQMNKYQNSLMSFYKEIKDLYFRYQAMRKDSLRISPEFEALVLEAIAYTDDKVNARPQRQYRLARLDDWKIEYVIRYENVPGVGHKVTGCHGDKGIIVKVEEDENMPVDENGVRADMVWESMSTISRSTIGKAIEPFLNSAGRDLVASIAKSLNLTPGTQIQPQLIKLKDMNVVRREFTRLVNFYNTVSEEHMGPWHQNLDDEQMCTHLAFVISRTLPLMYKPPSEEKEMLQIIGEIMQDFMPERTHVTYVGNSGKKITTKEKFLIGPAYVILLDKTGVDGAAIASCKLGHFGVPSQITRQDKYSSPNRRQPTRSLGEAEMRILISFCKPWVTAEIVDRNTNKDTMGMMIANILRANIPSAVYNLVDREKIPFNSSRPLQIVRHLAECAGWGFQYKPYQPKWNERDIEEYKRNELTGTVSTQIGSSEH